MGAGVADDTRAARTVWPGSRSRMVCGRSGWYWGLTVWVQLSGLGGGLPGGCPVRGAMRAGPWYSPSLTRGACGLRSGSGARRSAACVLRCLRHVYIVHVHRAAGPVLGPGQGPPIG